MSSLMAPAWKSLACHEDLCELCQSDACGCERCHWTSALDGDIDVGDDWLREERDALRRADV